MTMDAPPSTARRTGVTREGFRASWLPLARQPRGRRYWLIGFDAQGREAVRAASAVRSQATTQARALFRARPWLTACDVRPEHEEGGPDFHTPPVYTLRRLHPVPDQSTP